MNIAFDSKISSIKGKDIELLFLTSQKYLLNVKVYKTHYFFDIFIDKT